MATKRAADGRFVSRTSRADRVGRSERSRSTRSRTERRGDGQTVRVPDVGHDRTRHVIVHHRPEGALDRPHRQEKISQADRSQDARNLDRR